MCFPYRRAIMRSTLEPDPCRYAAHGLRNNESLFIYFFHLQSVIHRQGYAPVISLRRQWLPDTSAPCKRCRHLAISAGWGRTHETRRRGRAHVHKSNLSPESNPILFVFHTVRAGERALLAETWTGKVITFSGGFGVACHPHLCCCFSPTHHFGREGRFQSLCSCHPSFIKLLTAKSKWILWVIACCRRSNLIFSAAPHCLWMNRRCISSCTRGCSVAVLFFLNVSWRGTVWFLLL